MARSSRGSSAAWLVVPTPLALSLSLLVLAAAALLAVDASPRSGGYASRMRAGAFQQGDQKGQRTTRGFKNLELSVARGFGKRSGAGGGAVEEAEEDGLSRGARPPPLPAAAAAVASRLRWFNGGDASGDEGTEDEGRREAGPFPWQFGPGSRFPDQWLAEEVAGNPGLAQVLVRRFVDEDGDGEVTAEEMLRPFAS